jgi:hypothetical protein
MVVELQREEEERWIRCSYCLNRYFNLPSNSIFNEKGVPFPTESDQEDAETIIGSVEGICFGSVKQIEKDLDDYTVFLGWFLQMYDSGRNIERR